MSDKIELRNGQQIREWASRNGFDVLVAPDPDAPRFFEPRSTAGGPLELYSVEHRFQNGNQTIVTLKRVIRASSAEDALYQYFREPKERSAGNYEYRVGFVLSVKPGTTDGEAISVAKQPMA